MIENFLVGNSQKWVWPIWSLDSKINCISSPEWTNGINWFFACWHKFTQTKRWLKNFWVSMVKNGCGQFGDGTLNLTVSEEWTDGIKWFFAYQYKFRKAKCWFSDFWMGMVKNDHGLLVHETLLYLKNEFMNWADFLNVDSDAIIFG